jgi:hypothetical protein
MLITLMWPQWHRGVVSSNPPPLVDIQPDSNESGFFLPEYFIGTRMST